MNTKRVALLTGTSSGIGLSAAIFLARVGFHVVATMRDLSKAMALQQRAASENLNIELARLDVQDDASIKACVANILAQHGRLDLLLNNAGSGFVATTEKTSMQSLQKVMDVDFFGVWRCTQAVLPTMRAARSGRIISISSVGGLIGQPFNDAYCAAKFAVEGMMESLNPVVKFFGVHVSIVEPGPVITEFVATATKATSENVPAATDDYSPLYDRYMQGVQAAFANAGQSGDDVAAVIVKAATDESPHLRYLTSEPVKGLVGRKYVDVTGDSIVAMTGSRLAPAK